jgi:hypothetical protein
MAVGFPAKTTYANGDVYSASDVNDLAGTLNLIKPSAKGDLFAGSAANTYTKLSVGTNGYALVADSTAATGLAWSPAGMILISTTSLTGASVSLSSIPSTYTNLWLVVQNYLPATNDVAMICRINGDSNTRYSNRATTDTQNTATTFTSTFAQLSPNGSNTTANGLITALFPNYTNTVTWKMMQNYAFTNDSTTSTSFRHRIGMSIYNQTGAISSLDLLPNGGGNFTSGTALLYGVK